MKINKHIKYIKIYEPIMSLPLHPTTKKEDFIGHLLGILEY